MMLVGTLILPRAPAQELRLKPSRMNGTMHSPFYRFGRSTPRTIEDRAGEVAQCATRERSILARPSTCRVTANGRLEIVRARCLRSERIAPCVRYINF